FSKLLLSKKTKSQQINFSIGSRSLKWQFLFSSFLKSPIDVVMGYTKHVLREVYLRYSLALKYLLVVSPANDFELLESKLKNTTSQFIHIEYKSIWLILLFFYFKPVSVSTTYIVLAEHSLPLINKQFYLTHLNQFNEYIKTR